MKQFNVEEYRKNPSNKVVTRDGRNVTIHCTNCAGPRPVVAQIEGDNYSLNFDKYGRYYFGTSDVDLFFAPEKHEGWIVINKWPDGVRDTNGIIYHTKLDIPDMPPVGVQRVATIKIEWEE